MLDPVTPKQDPPAFNLSPSGPASRTSWTWSTPEIKGSRSVSTGSQQSRQNGSRAAAAASEEEIEAAKEEQSGREDVPPVSGFPSHPKVVDPPCAGEQGTSAGGRRATATTLSPLTREFYFTQVKSASFLSFFLQFAFAAHNSRGDAEGFRSW